jgi:hypothetical protein
MDRAGSRPTSGLMRAVPGVDGRSGAGPARSVRSRSNWFILLVAGVCLIAGGVLWQPLLAVEHIDRLGQQSTPWGWYADQEGFLLALVLVLVGLAALDRARVAAWSGAAHCMAWCSAGSCSFSPRPPRCGSPGRRRTR